MISRINEWLINEKKLSSPAPDRMVLSTISENSTPHSRIVAIREITENGIVFFTQQGTRKVSEISNNPAVSLLLWLPLQQRQIILEGTAKKLTVDENQFYWDSLPHDRQIRFSAYAPTSGQVIKSIEEVNAEYQLLCDRYENEDVPMSQFYCGFRVIPKTIYFYTLGTTNFSEVKRFVKINGTWNEETLSP